MEVADGDGVDVHRFNAELPYRDRLPEENELLLSEVKEALASFAIHGDVRRILQACSGAYVFTGQLTEPVRCIIAVLHFRSFRFPHCAMRRV